MVITHLSGILEKKFLCNIMRFLKNGIYRTCFTLYALYAYFGLGNDPTIKILHAQVIFFIDSQLPGKQS